ncbi:MAG TPA: DUF5615 family PIN-like protein [Dehalococcoidia bacterium]|nr:DUF5615 family PIN-like protein [Dehalococcoidia bacterium]
MDESVDARLRGLLNALGYDTNSISIEHPSSISDREVLAIAVDGNRILVTNDRDFGDLIIKAGLPHRGVIYLRLRNRHPDHAARRLQDVVSRFSDRLDEFIVVTDYMVRPRGPKSPRT